jgi:GNAT superfamily N-acetyltransferase
MYTRLGEEKLKSGERLETGVVLGPDVEWLPRIAPFLRHKGPDYGTHIRRALEGPLDSLQTRFYLGTRSGEILAQMMVVGDRGAGILGHVYTRPEDRRKGAASLLMRYQMEDCRRSGYRVLCLGTGFETPPYWIYHSFGFRSVGPGNGCMKWLAAPEAELELLRAAPVRIRDARWDDWGYFDLLALQAVSAGEELPRSLTLGVKTQGSAEGPFVGLQLRREREPRLQAKALVSESGATVGWALLGPDPRWFQDAWLLDLYAHPLFTRHLPELLEALDLPDAPVAAYLTSPNGPRAAALGGKGFKLTASLPGWLIVEGARRDVSMWVHSA